MRATIFLALFLAAAAALAADCDTSPVDLIEQTAVSLGDKLEGKRESIENDPAAANQIIKDTLLERFNTNYAARLVLGRHSRGIEQKKLERFQDAFYEFLVGKYAEHLTAYTRDRVEIQPLRGEPDERRTIVQTEVRLDDGTMAPVDYVLHKTPQCWRAYDVVIEGISYVRNYRKTFDSEIRQTSLDALIERLEKQGRQYLEGEKRAADEAQ